MLNHVVQYRPGGWRRSSGPARRGVFVCTVGGEAVAARLLKRTSTPCFWHSLRMYSVNRLLKKCRETLHGEDSLDFLDVLDEDALPQNSDVVLMLSQYVAAMEA